MAGVTMESDIAWIGHILGKLSYISFNNQWRDREKL